VSYSNQRWRRGAAAMVHVTNAPGGPRCF